MSKRRKLCLWAGLLSLCLIITGLLFLFPQNQKLLLWKRDGSGATQYLFPKQGETDVSFDLGLIEGAFVKPAGPPFLIAGKPLATFNASNENNESSENDETNADVKNNEINEIRNYIVQKKDTLKSISQRFGISQETILWANNLDKDSSIKSGQKLVILPVSGVLYLVKQGDTLSAIAKKYKAEIEEIIAFNQLADEDDIFAGDFLIIPNGQLTLNTSSKTSSIAKEADANETTTKETTPTTEIPVAESYFIFPTEGEITQTSHGVLGNAVDIANRCGTPIVAAASGKVQRTGNAWPEGKKITILHSNGVVSYYIHLSNILVQQGQEVAAGDIIGYMGNTGYTVGTTGCHLHFEIRGAKNFLTEHPEGSSLKWGAR